MCEDPQSFLDAVAVGEQSLIMPAVACVTTLRLPLNAQASVATSVLVGQHGIRVHLKPQTTEIATERGRRGRRFISTGTTTSVIFRL